MVVVCSSYDSTERKVAQYLCEKHSFATPVCVTTRARREDETEGEAFYFVDSSEWDFLTETDKLFVSIEWEEECFGVERSELLRIMSCGRIPVIELSVERARQLKEKYPEELILLMMGEDEEWMDAFAGQEEEIMSRFFGCGDIFQKKKELDQMRDRMMRAQRVLFGKKTSN